MKILFIDEQTTGCFYYRTKLYADELSKLGHEVMIASGDTLPEDILAYDIYSFNRTGSGDFASSFCFLRDRGKKIVYDTDDAINLVEPTNTVYNLVRSVMHNYYYMLNEADLITTTTPLLGNEISNHTDKPIYIIPNCINTEDWQERPKNHDRLRIGFAGSNSHLRDIVPALDAIIKLQKDYDFDFILAGFSSQHETWQDWIKASYEAAQNPNLPYYKSIVEIEQRFKVLKNFQWIKAVNVFNYPKFLSELDLDIGLAPVLNTRFNQNKSEIKLMEYAMVGTPTIASNNPPFTDTPAILVENTPDKWYNGIRNLIDKGKEYRNNISEFQKDWVLTNRNIKDWTKRREEVYKELLNGQS